MDIAYHAPCARLASLASCYGTFAGDGEARLLSLPALLGQVHINLGDPGYYQFADGRIVATPTVALCGPFNSAFRFLAPPDFRFITVGLLATGWHRLARLPAIDLADTVIDAACLWAPGRIDRLMSRLAGLPLDGRHIAVVEDFLLEGVAGDAAISAYAGAVDQWLEQSRSLSLDRLGQKLGVSQRQIARITQELHGASPKTLAMKYRALRSATALAVSGEEAMDDAMADFTDQSHLIRDFRRFIGTTPRRFLQEQSPMARLTIERRWRAGISRPLALWS